LLVNKALTAENEEPPARLVDFFFGMTGMPSTYGTTNESNIISYLHLYRDIQFLVI